jgi:predicted kinase
MGELRLLIGLPGSGKSMYAAKLMQARPHNWHHINWDEMRRERGMHLRKFNRDEEEQMKKDSFSLAESWGKEGGNVLVDNTNLSESTRNRWRGVAQRASMNYFEDAMPATLQECIDRDSLREGAERVGRAVIERMALMSGLISFQPWERLVLVDMDGTLADCEHRRQFIREGRHDWDNFEAQTLKDEVIYPIMNLVNILYREGYTIIIVSGRQIDRAGKDTETWLKMKANFQHRHLFMRNGEDSRPDNVVKQEILDKLPKDQIAYVLDDRNQVVEMWRKNGLTCLQVADGNF